MNAEQQQVLRARADALARPPQRPEVDQDALQVIEFVLASETHAIESRFIREIYSLKEITAIPCTPPFVIGMINVRGQIITVINIKTFFGLPEQGLSDLNQVIIVQAGEIEMGILADAILGVRLVRPTDLQPPPTTLSGIRADYLRGVTKERMAVLDVAAIVSDPRLRVQEEVGV